jgi:hypothetical protein
VKPLVRWLAIVGGLAGLSRAAGQVDCLRDVKPVLKGRCYAYFEALQQKAKLRLDTIALMLEGAGPLPEETAVTASRRR